MTRAPLLCAGLESDSLNAVCARRAQCARHANWWQTAGVQFNVCRPTGQAFKHFVALHQQAAEPQPAVIGQTLDLFA